MCVDLRRIPGYTFARASNRQQRRDEVDNVQWGQYRLSDHGYTRNDRCGCRLTVRPSILFWAMRLETFADRHLVGDDCKHRAMDPYVCK